MKKISFKLFLTLTVILIGIFSLFFISNTKVSAQAGNEIIVKTTGYSVLSPNSFIFGGYYSGNIERKGFTTYFQFKKNDSNLDVNAEETIKIIRETDVEEFNDFYTSPELNLFSNYYFRAVGYFNDNPSEKFYGGVLNLRTGYIPVGFHIPFTIDENAIVAPSIPLEAAKLAANIEIGKVAGVQSAYMAAGGLNTDSVYTEVTTAKETVAVAMVSNIVNNIISTTTTLTNKTNTLKTATTELNSPILTPPAEPADSNTGLVPCTDDCGFYDIMTLINNVVRFILFNLVIPIAAIMFAYAGFELLTSGGETSKREKAKTIFLNVAIGLIVAVAAFLIVQTVLSIVGYDKSWDWFGF